MALTQELGQPAPAGRALEMIEEARLAWDSRKKTLEGKLRGTAPLPGTSQLEWEFNKKELEWMQEREKKYPRREP